MVVVGAARRRLYGTATKVRQLRREAPTAKSLVRWVPLTAMVDPYDFLDLTSPWEQAWVSRWMAEEYRAVGAIVELGTWLGATTRAINRGLDRPALVDVYDTFRFSDVEDRVAGTPLEGHLSDGVGFRSLYESRAGGQLVVHEGDILTANGFGRPIEFLFVDLAKTWTIWCHVRAAFVRHLMEGGVLVQQDWAHANTPWLHLWHHRWRGCFDVVGHVPHSGSVAFRLVRPLPPAALDPDDMGDYDAEEVFHAFAWAATLVAPAQRSNVAGAHVLLHAFHGRLEDATDVLLEYASRGPLTGDLATVAGPELGRRWVARHLDPES